MTEDGQPQDIAFVEFQRMQGRRRAAPAPAARRCADRQRLPLRPRHPQRRRRPTTQVERATVTGIAVTASRRHPVSGSPAAGLLLRRLGDVAARSDSRVHECAEVHRHADDAGRPGRDHGVPGRRGLGEDRLHRQQEHAARSHSDPDLRRRSEQRRHRGSPGRDGVRTERRRVQHLQHRPSARRAADGGLDAASAAGAEDAPLLRERHATQWLRQSGTASRNGERGASARTSRSTRSTHAAWSPRLHSATPRARRPAASACSPASSPKRPSPTSSGRRTRSTRSPRTPAARRCSTTTISRSASSRPRRPSATTTSSATTARTSIPTGSSAACASR